MEATISTVISQMKAEGNLPAATQQCSSQSSLARAMPPAIVALQKNYPSINEFLVAYSPDRQTEICYAPEACYFGDSPTLATLTSCYGRGAAEAWLVPEIIDACLFFGLKEQPDTYQLEKLARIIVTNFGYLNVDEVQLFFFYLLAIVTSITPLTLPSLFLACVISCVIGVMLMKKGNKGKENVNEKSGRRTPSPTKNTSDGRKIKHFDNVRAMGLPMPHF